jgi:hypothetical protein
MNGMIVKKIDIKLRGINQVMKSPGVQTLIDHAAHHIAAEAGEGFEYRSGKKKHRWVARAYVDAVTMEARIAEARNKTLTRAVGSGGG